MSSTEDEGEGVEEGRGGAGERVGVGNGSVENHNSVNLHCWAMSRVSRVAMAAVKPHGSDFNIQAWHCA